MEMPERIVMKSVLVGSMIVAAGVATLAWTAFVLWLGMMLVGWVLSIAVA
jgi:hypothetical protein